LTVPHDCPPSPTALSPSEAPLQPLLHFKQPSGDGQQVKNKQIATSETMLDLQIQTTKPSCPNPRISPLLQVHGIRFVSSSSLALARGGRYDPVASRCFGHS
jgi:hypothetical protein